MSKLVDIVSHHRQSYLSESRRIQAYLADTSMTPNLGLSEMRSDPRELALVSR